MTKYKKHKKTNNTIYDSKDFTKLKLEWYDKLKRDGFQDIEEQSKPSDLRKGSWDLRQLKKNGAQVKRIIQQKETFQVLSHTPLAFFMLYGDFHALFTSIYPNKPLPKLDISTTYGLTASKVLNTASKVLNTASKVLNTASKVLNTASKASSKSLQSSNHDSTTTPQPPLKSHNKHTNDSTSQAHNNLSTDSTSSLDGADSSHDLSTIVSIKINKIDSSSVEALSFNELQTRDVSTLNTVEALSFNELQTRHDTCKGKEDVSTLNTVEALSFNELRDLPRLSKQPYDIDVFYLMLLGYCEGQTKKEISEALQVYYTNNKCSQPHSIYYVHTSLEKVFTAANNFYSVNQNREGLDWNIQTKSNKYNNFFYQGVSQAPNKKLTDTKQDLESDLQDFMINNNPTSEI